MRVDDVRRLDLGTFLRPAVETGTGVPRVEAVYGYVFRSPEGLILLDTGLGVADPETEDWYRPRRIPVRAALATVGVAIEDVSLVVNCHLHFDHIGGNPLFAGHPIVCQRQELAVARAGDYTVESLVDFGGAHYEMIDGEVEIVKGVHIIPTPGHVAGHQSIVVECADGSVVLAGQAHDTASQWSADVLAEQAGALGYGGPRPSASPWMSRLLEFEPRQVFFAHDAAVWIP